MPQRQQPWRRCQGCITVVHPCATSRPPQWWLPASELRVTGEHVDERVRVAVLVEVALRDTRRRLRHLLHVQVPLPVPVPAPVARVPVPVAPPTVLPFLVPVLVLGPPELGLAVRHLVRRDGRVLLLDPDVPRRTELLDDRAVQRDVEHRRVARVVVPATERR